MASDTTTATTSTQAAPSENFPLPDPMGSTSRHCSTCYGAFITHDPSSETQYCKPKCEEESRQFFAFLDKAVGTKIDTLNLPELDTQIVINLLQTALHLPRYATSRRRIRKMVLKLSLKYSKLPASLFLKDVTCSVVESHSSGSFADIYIGEFNGLRVALKRLRIFQMIARSKREELKRAFYHESLIWKNLDHCHILPFLGIDDTIFPRSLCMVLPWMGLGNIRDTIDHMRSTLSERDLSTQILTWISDIPSGLDYLHTEGIVHGDLRGANILIDHELHVRLADFGLAVFAEGASREYGSVRGGNARWLAAELIHPELFSLTSERPTYAGDTFAFGCVCVELCTGQIPYFGVSDNQVIARVPLGLRPSRPAFSGETPIPDSLWGIIQRCWDQSASERPSAEVLVEATKEFWRPQIPQNDRIEASLSPVVPSLLDGHPCSNESPSQVAMRSSVTLPTTNTLDNDGAMSTVPSPGGPQIARQSDLPEKPSQQISSPGQNHLSPSGHSDLDPSSISFGEHSGYGTSYEHGTDVERGQPVLATIATSQFIPSQSGPGSTHITSGFDLQGGLGLVNSDSPTDYNLLHPMGTYDDESMPPLGNNNLLISVSPPVCDDLSPEVRDHTSFQISAALCDSPEPFNADLDMPSADAAPGLFVSAGSSQVSSDRLAVPQLPHRRHHSDRTSDRGRDRVSTVYVYPPASYKQSDSPSLLPPPTLSSLELGFVTLPSFVPSIGHRRQSGAVTPSVRVSPYPSPSVAPRRSSGTNRTGESMEHSRGVRNGTIDHGTNTDYDTSSDTSTDGEVPTMVPNEDTSTPLVKRQSASFVCPVPGCGSTFTRHFNLKGHLRSHEEEKPYQCKWPGCGKGFVRQQDCKRHEQLHANRTYSCEGCKKNFPGEDALERHLQSEGGAECRRMTAELITA